MGSVNEWKQGFANGESLRKELEELQAQRLTDTGYIIP